VTNLSATLSAQAAQITRLNSTVSSLSAALNAQAAQLSRLDGNVTAADLVGTYAFIAYQTEVDEEYGPDPTVDKITGTLVQHEVYSGKCTLNGNGTYSCTSEGTGYRSGGLPGSGFGSFSESSGSSGTWELSGGNIVTDSGGVLHTFSMTAGGNVGMSVQANINAKAKYGGGDTTLLIILRIQ
jgi:hypothetical protein